VRIGLAGAAPPKESMPWGAWYSWRVTDLNRRQSAPLHKLRYNDGRWPASIEYDAGASAVQMIADRLATDVVGASMGWRVLQLFNEPLNQNESNWRDSPKEAAYWCAQVMYYVRARAPWVRFAGPNLGQLDLGWALTFLNELAKLRAPLDIYSMHGYEAFYLGWQAIQEHVQAVRAQAPCLGLVPGAPVWVTEIGDLWASTSEQVRAWMREIEAFQQLYGEGLGINAWLWFVSYDSTWYQLSPRTCIYDGSGAAARLTREGQAWWSVCQNLLQG